MKKDIRKDIFTIIAVTVAAFLMALNTKTFVNTGGLYPGGMTGMSILIQRAVKQLAGIMLPFSIINITLNIIPVYIGFRFIGKKFTAFSCVMILLNSFFTDLIPNHIITQDVLLISIFGGMINGVAISLCLNRGATSGGLYIHLSFREKQYGHLQCYTWLQCGHIVRCRLYVWLGQSTVLYHLSICFNNRFAYALQKIPAKHLAYRNKQAQRDSRRYLCSEPAWRDHT